MFPQGIVFSAVKVNLFLSRSSFRGKREKATFPTELS